MIKKITIPVAKDGFGYDLSDGVFARVQTDEGTISLYSDIVNKYWDYVNEDEIEGISAWTNGSKVIVEFCVASGQGGVVTVWNEKGEMIHISNAEFGIASTVYDQYVYTLRGITYYGHPLSYSLTRVPFGTMDAWASDILEVDESFILEDEKVYDAFLKNITIDLNVNADYYHISYGDEKTVIKKTLVAWEKGVDFYKNVNQRVRISTDDVNLVEFEGSLLSRSVIVTAERMDDGVKVTSKTISDENDVNSKEEQLDLLFFEDMLSGLALIEINVIRSGYSKDVFIIVGEDDISKNWSLRIGYRDGHKVEYIGCGGIDSTFISFSELLAKSISTFGDVQKMFNAFEE